MVRFRKASFVCIAFILGVCGAHSSTLGGQKPASQSVDDILLKAEIAAHNVGEAITEHITNDANFHWTKQLPEDKRPDPGILVKKDESFSFDWTPGQHARHLMEELRQGIHQLQSAEKPSGLDGIALAGAREYWPKVRDISCAESPGIRYYDLNGYSQFCPEH
jgi:hypothetical protein